MCLGEGYDTGSVTGEMIWTGIYGDVSERRSNCAMPPKAGEGPLETGQRNHVDGVGCKLTGSDPFRGRVFPFCHSSFGGACCWQDRLYHTSGYKEFRYVASNSPTRLNLFGEPKGCMLFKPNHGSILIWSSQKDFNS